MPKGKYYEYQIKRGALDEYDYLEIAVGHVQDTLVSDVDISALFERLELIVLTEEE